DDIASLNARFRRFVDQFGRDELVGHILIIRGLQRFLRSVKAFALAIHQQIVSLFRALPAVVAVHSIIAAYNRCNLPGANFFSLFLELLYLVRSTVRISITAVGESMNIGIGNACLLGKL